MKIRTVLTATAAAFLLSACYLTPPGVPLSDVPADPLVQALQLRRSSFTSLKGIARVESEHRGRTRTYESVAIILKAQERFRVEGYGPLGETLFILLWDGTDVFLKRAGDENVQRTGQFGFERMLGVSLSPSDLCAILSGNMPAMPSDAETSARCSQDGWCLVDIRHDDLQWQVRVIPPYGGQQTAVIEDMKLFRNGNEVLSTWFVYQDPGGPRQFPAAVGLAQKGRTASLLVQYQDVDVNVPLDDGTFTLGPGAER